MCFTNGLRNQNDRLLKIIDEVDILMKHPVENSIQIKQQLTSLLGTLQIHFNADEMVVYPKLMNHENHSVSKIASQCHEEVDELEIECLNYVKKWKIDGMIQRQPAIFAKETRMTFERLKNSIHLENKRLYPLFEQFIG